MLWGLRCSLWGPERAASVPVRSQHTGPGAGRPAERGDSAPSSASSAHVAGPPCGPQCPPCSGSWGEPQLTLTSVVWYDGAGEPAAPRKHDPGGRPQRLPLCARWASSGAQENRARPGRTRGQEGDPGAHRKPALGAERQDASQVAALPPVLSPHAASESFSGGFIDWGCLRSGQPRLQRFHGPVGPRGGPATHAHAPGLCREDASPQSTRGLRKLRQVELVSQRSEVFMVVSVSVLLPRRLLGIYLSNARHLHLMSRYGLCIMIKLSKR